MQLCPPCTGLTRAVLQSNPYVPVARSVPSYSVHPSRKSAFSAVTNLTVAGQELYTAYTT